MKKTVGYFTEEKLKELSSQENTVVMQPTYDTIFEPWPTNRVNVCVDTIVAMTKSMSESTCDEIQNYVKNHSKNLEEFSNHYQVMFKKITDPSFIQDEENISIVKKMILLKSAVDKNITSNEEAQAQASDIALKSLAQRVRDSRSK